MKIINGFKEYGLTHTIRLIFFQLYAYFPTRWADRGKFLNDKNKYFKYKKIEAGKIKIVVYIDNLLNESECSTIASNLISFPRKKIMLLFKEQNIENIKKCELSQYEYISYNEKITKKEIDQLLTDTFDTHFCMVHYNNKIFLNTIVLSQKVLKHKKYDLIYYDNLQVDIDKLTRKFKSDFSVEMLLNYNYIGECFTVSKGVLEKCNGFVCLYDILLQCISLRYVKRHISKLLYIGKVNDYNDEEVLKYFLRENVGNVQVFRRSWKGGYKLRFPIYNTPLVTILIPNKDHVNELQKCVKSILEKTNYSNFEVLILENNSKCNETFVYYDDLERQYERVHVDNWYGREFNYSKINNYGVSRAKGEFIVLLNNDMEVITGGWLEEMLMYAQQSGIGAVGAKLIFPDNTIQHAGVIVGIGGCAGHSHKNISADCLGYDKRLDCVQNVSAVTGACLMIEKKKFYQVGGLDEQLEVTLNDVDFCLRLQEIGYRNVFVPDAQLYHYESKSRGADNTLKKQRRYNKEIKYFKQRWRKFLQKGDRFYNRNLTLLREDYSEAP